MGAIVPPRGLQAGGRRLTERVARVVPDVSGIEAEFDYLIPTQLNDRVRVGTIVRVVLANRRVRGWVVDDDATPPDGVTLKPIQKVTGVGPSRELIDLAGWAAWRWAGKRSFFLQTASPQKAVSEKAVPADPLPPSVEAAGMSDTRRGSTLEIVRVPPATSVLDRVLEAIDNGPSLVLTPAHRTAHQLVERLRVEGRRVALYPDDWAMAARGNVSVIGTRAGVWAPMPTITGVLILDAHDESFQSERSPTWNAIDIAIERARRNDVPCTLLSAVPRVQQLNTAALTTVDRNTERAGWAAVHVVDVRNTDPRSGMYTPRLVELLRSDRRVVCVLNRKGRAQLLICTSCDEIPRCQQCTGSLSLDDDLVCSRCSARQPVVCVHCGATAFKQLRPGVQRVREDLESLALRPVGDITGEAKELPDAEILVGTEAVLHRVGRADAVVFLDFDQELLASRYQAPEDALILLARASRLVGGRKRDGVVMVQTRQPDHDVIQAALHADPSRFSEPERERRAAMGWPPFTAMARVSGKSAEQYVSQLEQVDLLGPLDDVWLVRAPTHDVLCDALAAAPRPSGNTLRVEVDPTRV